LFGGREVDGFPRILNDEDSPKWINTWIKMVDKYRVKV
jgi:hypothetical protein